MQGGGTHTAQEIAFIEKEIEDTDSDDGWSPKFTIHDKQISRGTDRLTTVEELDSEPADVFFHVDMYDSVLVAAFGGVTMNLDGSDELHVHPGILFIFCVPLVLLQFWVTFCTTFGMPAYWRSLDVSAEESMVISMKLLLIVVVQLTFFDNMLMTLRCFMFAINPTTWTDVKRIDPEDQRTGRSKLNVLHWSPFLAPFPIMALLTKVMMQYWVSVQSMSIIMASDNVKEAVFDALAISFIVELDVAMWNLVRTIMHLDSFENFTFQLWPMSRRARAMLSSPVARLVDFDVLHRGKGARRLENFIVHTVLFALYARITLVSFHAADSGILPASRDVCAMWSWYKDDFQTWEDTLKGYFVLELLEAFSCMSKFPWDIRKEISKMADPDLGGYCTEEFRPLSFQKAIELCRKHPRSMILFLVAFSALLLLPQLVYSTGALQEVIKNLDFAQQPDDVEEEGQADAAIEQSMLNARKIKHLGRVVSSHIVDLNKRMRKFEKLTGITAGEAYPNESPPNGQANQPAIPSASLRPPDGTSTYVQVPTVSPNVPSARKASQESLLGPQNGLRPVLSPSRSVVYFQSPRRF